MGAFGQPNLKAPPVGGGVPQWFTKAGDPHSWFPGAPQFNFSMQDMISSFGALDPEFNQLQTNLGAYGQEAQKGILQSGQVASTNAADKLAAMYGGATDPTVASGLAELGGDAGSIDKYAADRMGLSQIMAQAQGQASQVPGKISLAQQQVENQYRQNQMRSLKQIIDTISNAAGGQYGYQAAQLGADQGQIALANAQSREQAQNWGNLFGLGNMGASFLGNMGSATGTGGGLDFASQMANLGDAGMGAGPGMGALMMTMGMA